MADLKTNKPVYKVYVDALSRSDAETEFVETGLAVTPSTLLTLAYAAGTAVVNGGDMYVLGSGTTVLATADATNPRRDIVYVNSSGAVANTAGTPAASNPLPAAIPAGACLLAVVEVAAGQTTIAAGDIIDARHFNQHFYSQSLAGVI